MKKVILSLMLIAATTTIYSQTKATKTMETSANKEITLGLSKAIMNGQWDKVDALLDENFQYIGDGQAPIGKQAYIYFMKEMLCTAMTNMDMKFPRVIAEGDMVSVDYINEMTNSGPFFGIPATNKRVMGTGQFIRQIKDGKVVAEWQTTNMYGLMVQLGVIPSPQGK
ncbi:MAG: ester cyclase [Bacteroidota bacterium]